MRVRPALVVGIWR